MARPKVENRKIVTTMRLDKSLLKGLAQRSKREGRSRSNLVEQILTRDQASYDKTAKNNDVLG